MNGDSGNRTPETMANRSPDDRCVWTRMPDDEQRWMQPVRFYLACADEIARGRYPFYPDNCPQCGKPVVIHSENGEPVKSEAVTSNPLDTAVVKLAVLKVSFGICALPEAELFRKLEEFYLEAYARGVADRPSDETAASPQAPIARVIVSEDAPAQVLLYAPGLPIGEHDLYCEPTARVKSISQELRERGFPRKEALPNDEPAVKASALPSATLADFGYAPGVYAFHCLDCDQEELGDKRSIRCKSCAEKALAALNGSDVTNEVK